MVAAAPEAALVQAMSEFSSRAEAKADDAGCMADSPPKKGSIAIPPKKGQ